MTIGNHRRGLGEFIHLMPIEAWIEKCFSWSWRLHNLGITEALTDFGVRRPETHSYRGSGVCYVALIRIFVGKRMHCIIQRRFCVGREGGVLIGKPALAPKQQWFKCNARKGTPFPTSSLFVLLQCQEKRRHSGVYLNVSKCFPKAPHVNAVFNFMLPKKGVPTAVIWTVQVMSVLRSWTGREFHKRGQTAAKLSP